jgi:hypothetical protein
MKEFLYSILFLVTVEVNAQVIISEINYNTDSTISAGDWIELWNTGAATQDISGWQFIDSDPLHIPFVIPAGTTLPANQRIVLVANLVKFDSKHPGVNRLGNFSFGLSNSGELLKLMNSTGVPLVQFTYDDSLPWPKCADGYGRTLELVSASADPSLASSWSCGCLNGSPGTPRVTCTNEPVIVSEINYKSAPLANSGDWVEIRNTTTMAKDLSGWKLRDDNFSNIYTFPPGTFLNPMSRLVVFSNDALFSARHPFVTNKVGPFLFGLSSNGDAVRLYNQNELLQTSVYYFSTPPWPTGADSLGYTLELDTLFDFNQDICAASSWFNGCPEGSPGLAFGKCQTSIEFVETEKAIIFPNPVSDVLNIITENGNSPLSYHITDVSGKSVQSNVVENVLNSFAVSVSSLQSGIYFIHLKSDKKYHILKFIHL